MAQASPASIRVAGNVAGSIVVGDNNFVVNTNHGTVIYKQAAPRVQLRGAAPLPPRKPRGFVGRTSELAQLEGWIGAGEPAYIYGQDGIGKTTLAKQAANGQAAAGVPNGVLFVEGVDEEGRLLGLGDLVQRLFDALFESEPPLKVDLASARTYLSNTRPLVLVSGATLPMDAFNRLPDLFPAAPVLVETVQPPAGDSYQVLALGPLGPDEGLALLAARANLSLDDKNRPILAEIAQLLDHVPAALVAVGNAILGRRLIPEMTAELLRGVAPASSDPVQQALERAYRVTLPALSDAERRALAQAAAAPGLSVDRAWMESKFGDRPVTNAEILGLVTANSPRLRLAPGLRQMALEGSNADELREALYDRLAGLLNERWLDFEFVDAELGNLLGLLEWASTSGRDRITAYLARVLDPYLTLRGLWEARGRALDHYARAAGQDQAAQAWGMHQIGVQHVGAGELEQARSRFEQARDLRLSLGDSEGAAYSQHNLDVLGPPPLPPTSTTKGGGPSGWIRGVAVAALAVGMLVAGVLGFRAVAPVFRPTPTPLPSATAAPSATATRTATLTPSPSPSATATDTMTPTPTLPPSLDWRLDPESDNLSSQMPDGCRLSVVVPRVYGSSDPRITGFNSVVDNFISAETKRLQGYFAEHFGASCDPAAYAAAWSDEYRVTTWPADNYMDILPMTIYGDSATYASSDVLLSSYISSTYGYGGTAYNYSINYDLNRGRELALSDLFVSGSDYLGFLSQISIYQLTTSEFFCADPKVFAAPKAENYSTWNITYYGLRLTFNLYDVTPGPCSTAVVLIPYGDLAKILDPQGPLGKEIGQ